MEFFDFSTRWYEFLIMVLVSYLVGCFNFAVLISKTKNKDVTKMGSGNPGTMNMTRNFGFKIGALTFFCDALKGGLPVLIAYLIYKDTYFTGTSVQVSDVARYACGLFVIIGHIFPVTMKFKGGKGIASTFGLFWVGLSCESLWFILIGLGVVLLMLLFIYKVQLGSVASLIGVTVFGTMQAVTFLVRYATIEPPLIASFCMIFALVTLTYAAHRKNILQLFAGEEHRTKIGKSKKSV